MLYINNINDLFNDLFGKDENKPMALLYLSSLMSITETPEDHLAVKRRQTHLLQSYLTQNAVPDRAYYLEKVAALKEILSRDLQTMKNKEECR